MQDGWSERISTSLPDAASTARLGFTAGRGSVASRPMSRYILVRFDPDTIFRRTLCVIAALVGASLFAAFMQIERGHDYLRGFSDFVHLDQESNLPTFFSGVQLLGAGSIAWCLSSRESAVSLRWLWRFLGAGLCFMALDESVCIHEAGNELDLGSWRDVSYFRSAWVVPALAVVAICGAILLKLLLGLPRRTALMLVISGTIFVAGAVGMEMLGARYYQPRGCEDWRYTFCYTFEETLEMLGPALFIRTALRYAIEKRDGVAQDVVAS